MINDISHISVREEEPILSVMEKIDSAATGFAIVTDSDGKLSGVVTDGDIRRGFLGGKSVDMPVSSVMNRNPVTVSPNVSREEVFSVLNEKYSYIPVLDDGGKVVSVWTYSDKGGFSAVKRRVVAVIGEGFVGLTLSLVLADAGFKVYGYDKDKSKIDKLLNRKAYFYEEGIDSAIARLVGNNFFPCGDMDRGEADIYIISVGTPLDAEKKPNVAFIKESAKFVASKIKKGDLIILRSTVQVGTTRKVFIPIVESISSLKAGDGFFVVYAPERTVAGKALAELKELPQVIGGYCARSTALADAFFREVTSTIVDAGSIEAAEMVKILNNTFRDLKFAYANEMALVAKSFGLDMVKLVNVANHGYVRDKIPVPSPGVGGTCLKKDPYILMESCRSIDFSPTLVSAARKINEYMPEYIACEITGFLKDFGKGPDNVKIFILGFAFKGEPETSDMRDSTTFDIIDRLIRFGVSKDRFCGYDPVVPVKLIEEKGIRVEKPDDGVEGADVVILANNHKSYRNIDFPGLLKKGNEPVLFFDCWHMCDKNKFRGNKGIVYKGVGC